MSEWPGRTNNSQLVCSFVHDYVNYILTRVCVIISSLWEITANLNYFNWNKSRFRHKVFLHEHVCCENIPLFLCEFDHHGWELIQHKYTRQTLISNQPIGYFFMSGHWKLVCFHHLRKQNPFRNTICSLNTTDLQVPDWLDTPLISTLFLFFYSKTSCSGSTTFIKTLVVFQHFWISRSVSQRRIYTDQQ